MQISFDEKVIVVTGGSRGIGAAIVRQFIECGGRVFFTYGSSTDQANEISRETGATAIQCSQTDTARITETVREIARDEGRIDVLVNNAGITTFQLVPMMSDETWEKVLDTNLGGSFAWTRAATRVMMEARAGAIINVASLAGIVGIAGQANYCASKAALMGFTRAVAAECIGRGIRVNAVVPGFVETDMTNGLPRKARDRFLERLAIGRFGEVKEIAPLVAFLASEHASYIVGQSIVVDGGLSTTIALG